MQAIRAFQESRVLLSAIELDVFNAIGQGAVADDVARCLGTNARATEMLLNALASLGMLGKEGGLFRNTARSAQYFTRESPADARAAMLHQVHLWETWSTLTECVRTGGAADRKDTSERDANWTAAFIAAMHYNAAERAPELVRAVDASSARRLLDLGGGSGAYSIAFAQAHPELRAEILDVPAVVDLARGYIEAAGLSGRVIPRAGDLNQPDYGTGFDLVLISAICHMLAPEANREMLRKAFAALESGGRVVVRDFILSPDRTAPRAAALFALNMLVGTRHGNCYTEAEYAEWLAGAGFKQIRHIALPGPASLMIGVAGG